MIIEQGEIWMVAFYPKKGSEIDKMRPALVVSHNTIGKLPLKTIVPITDWKERYSHYPWMYGIKPDRINGLSKHSAVDCFQIKNFSDERFVKKLGEVPSTILTDIHLTITKTFNPNYTLQY